jgi:hypothetical protein
LLSQELPSKVFKVNNKEAPSKEAPTLKPQRHGHKGLRSGVVLQEEGFDEVTIFFIYLLGCMVQVCLCHYHILIE